MMKSFLQKKDKGNKAPAIPFFSKDRSQTQFKNNGVFFSPNIYTTQLKTSNPVGHIANTATSNIEGILMQQNTANSIQKKSNECEENDKPLLEKPGENIVGRSSFEGRLANASGKGSSLPDNTLTNMNCIFGADFSKVKIHHDKESARMNQELNAQAFAHGTDIYFSEGNYSPGMKEGKRLLVHELTHVMQQRNAGSKMISRKVSVENPTTNIPNPSGTGLVQTNEVTVLDYLFQLCPDTDIMVSSGIVNLLDNGFCLSTVKQKDGSFKSPAAVSKHPVSCECICEMITDPLQNIVIRIDDSSKGNAFTSSGAGGAIISVPSPNMNTHDVRGSSGKTISSPHFIVLGHELCGHHWLSKRGSRERENLQNASRGGHDPAIKRENLIRTEHGLEKRGTFRDPCCGILESTDQDLKKPSGKCGDIFEKQKDVKGTVAHECKHWREEYNKLNGTNFSTDDAIPEKTTEKLPAIWRIEILFKKDMPQSWHTLEQSLTEEGKSDLEVVTILLTKHPEFSAQLSGNASSDKPANDPTYNKRLADRRAKLVLDGLLKKFDKKRFMSFDSDCDKLQEGIHNCSDSGSDIKSNEIDRNVEVKLFNTP